MTFVDVGGLYRIGYRIPSSSSQPMCGGACPPLGKEFPMKFGVDQTPWAGYRSSGRVLYFWSGCGIMKPNWGE